MTSVVDNLNQVRARIQAAAAAAGRDAAEIRLLAVSKKQSVEKIIEAYRHLQVDFGENYVQEGEEKRGSLDLPLTWHYIGPIQSNKTKVLAEHWHWVHTIERSKIADRLSAQRPASLPPLNVCIQVNVDNDPNKSGCSPAQVKALAHHIEGLPGLKLRGLMTLPSLGHDGSPFKELHALLVDLQRTGLTKLDTLSMGMSADLELAIKYGATIVRIGTAVFGKRPE